MQIKLGLDQMPQIILKQISLYLNQQQTIILSQVSQQLRNKVISQDFWTNYHLNYPSQLQKLFTQWLTTHTHSLKLRQLTLIIHQDFKYLPTVLDKLNSNISHLQSLTVYLACYDDQIRVQIVMLLIKQTPLLKQLSTNIVPSNKQFKNILKHLQTLEITDQRAVIKYKHIEALPNVKNLIIRPYQIDFTSFANYLQGNQNVEELDLDCEYCQVSLLIKILKNLDKLSIMSLKLKHLEDMSSDALVILKKFTRLNSLCLTKTPSIYNFAWLQLFEQASYPYLLDINLTQAHDLQDSSLEHLIEKSPNLKLVNLSWCYKLTNNSISYLIKKCLNLQELVVVGIKSISDSAFEQFLTIKLHFNQKYYDEYRSKIINHQQYTPFDINNFFLKEIQMPQVLKKLKVLDCQSVNFVNDELLRIIGLFRKSARITNYYGNLMGIYDRETQRQYD